MSQCHWIIEGIGIDADRIRPYLNQNKLLDFLAEQLPENDYVIELVQSRENTGECPDFDIDDYLYGQRFQNIADLLTFCDDTDTITYGDDGEGSHYFYYPPSMPWDRREEDPKTIEEVHQRIIAAVQKVTDLSDGEIELMIDDELYVHGAG